MNNRFGRLNDDKTKLEYAKNFLKIGNVLCSRPTDEMYLENGWKRIVDEPLEDKDGYDVAFTGFIEDADTIRYNYEYVEQEDGGETDDSASGFEVSKIYLRIALMRLGLWDTIVTWIKSIKIPIADGIYINAYDAWTDALVVNTGSELFKPYLDLAKEQFKDVITGEQVDKILEECRAK